MANDRKPWERSIDREMPALVTLQDSYNMYMENVTIQNAERGIMLDGGSLYGRNVSIYDTNVPLEVVRGTTRFDNLEIGRRRRFRK